RGSSPGLVTICFSSPLAAGRRRPGRKRHRRVPRSPKHSVLTVRIIGMSIEKSRSSSGASRATSGFARLTAVVLNWDEPELTTRCVEALVGDGVPPGRIVVVDNGSQGDSFEQFERKLSECVLVRLPTNAGIARAAKIGAARLA